MNFKYGDVILAARRWGRKGIGYPQHTYRFRCDPVPFVWKNKYNFKNWYKRPKSTQEKRLSFAYTIYVRGKRSRWNLPDAWDDYQRGDVHNRKSWKNKKVRKQWMKQLKNN